MEFTTSADVVLTADCGRDAEPVRPVRMFCNTVTWLLMVVVCAVAQAWVAATSASRRALRAAASAILRVYLSFRPTCVRAPTLVGSFFSSALVLGPILLLVDELDVILVHNDRR